MSSATLAFIDER
jgi:hypothetical protein